LPTLAAPGETGDDDRSVADLTWGMDQGPGHGSAHHQIPDHAVPAALPLAAPPVGAAMQNRPRNSMARLALIVLFTIAAGLAVYQFLLRPKKQVVVVPPPAPALATVKFNVQPSDAVVEIAGKEVGRSSPFEAKLEPGVYSVAVRRTGYKPWSTEVTLRSAEPQTVHVALEQGLARINVTSQPLGLPVELDGKPLGQVTPVEIQVAAGNHRIVVTKPAKEEGFDWEQEFTAEIDRAYPFTATFGKDKRPATAQSTPGRRDAGAAAIARNPPAPPPASATHAPTAADRKRPAVGIGRGKEDDDVRITETPAETAPPPPVKQPAKSEAPAVVVPESPPPKASPSGPKTVPTVAANAVAKISGAIPTMKVEGITDNFADVVSKVCIDDRGHVTSVKILKALPEITDELQRTLSGWRYQPYTNSAGQLSPACFPVSFRVVFKRAS
jgi:hypothetical protein